MRTIPFARPGRRWLHLDRYKRRLLRLVSILALIVLIHGCNSHSDAVLDKADRLLFLDETGVYVLEGDQRELISEPLAHEFFFDAQISPSEGKLAVSIQLEPRWDGSTYDFGVDLFVGATSEPLKLLVRHATIGGSITRPNWLSGDDKILYSVIERDSSGAPDIRIETVDVHTGHRTRLIEHAVEPSLSPDDTTLAYVTLSEDGTEVIKLRNLRTLEERPLLPASQIMTNVANIAWSSDGSRIASAASARALGPVRPGLNTCVSPSFPSLSLDGERGWLKPDAPNGPGRLHAVPDMEQRRSEHLRPGQYRILENPRYGGGSPISRSTRDGRSTTNPTSGHSQVTLSKDRVVAHPRQ